MSSAETTKVIRHKTKALLDTKDYDAIVRLFDEHHPVLRLLISMTYDKGSVTSCRAIEAVGKLTARMPAEKARHIIQRLLWTMREESGSNAWSAAEIIGEIISNDPDPFEDIVPVLMSFHEEEFLRPGVLLAISKIARVRPDLAAPFSSVLLGYFNSPRPEERGPALFAIGGIGKKEHLSEVVKLLDDNAAFRHCDGNNLVEKPITDIASETVKKLQPR